MEKSTIAWIVTNYILMIALFLLCIFLIINKDARLSLS